ncbi:hypothetical protein LRH25_29375 [Ideonella azotifigens]|uniref:hypothetical protein n=1 Tax=Ideonella azotifigens TaxID=513160 RepID=UPI0014777284|nr:hypothetical protein [Ideonella azotifigens]MCD2344441.1 hypothetical protein [Ideonella azotifigens]
MTDVQKKKSGIMSIDSHFIGKTGAEHLREGFGAKMSIDGICGKEKPFLVFPRGSGPAFNASGKHAVHRVPWKLPSIDKMPLNRDERRAGPDE